MCPETQFSPLAQPLANNPETIHCNGGSLVNKPMAHDTFGLLVHLLSRFYQRCSFPDTQKHACTDLLHHIQAITTSRID